MKRTLLVLAIGALIGANAVYYVMTRSAPRPVVAQAPAPADSAAVKPVPATPVGAAAPVPPSNQPPPTSPPPAPVPASAVPPAPAAAALPTGALAIPVSGITAGQLQDTFDDARGSDRVHEALDILAPAGTPVVAVADGHIEKLFTSVPGGLTIYQFEPTGRYAYYYAHLQGYAPQLREKQPVRRGEVIGYVGSTGNADPAAPHLHFAVFELGSEKQWWKGKPINPYPLLGGAVPSAPSR